MLPTPGLKVVSHTVYYVNLFLGVAYYENNIPQLCKIYGIWVLFLWAIWDMGS